MPQLGLSNFDLGEVGGKEHLLQQACFFNLTKR